MNNNNNDNNNNNNNNNKLVLAPARPGLGWTGLGWPEGSECHDLEKKHRSADLENQSVVCNPPFRSGRVFPDRGIPTKPKTKTNHEKALFLYLRFLFR